MDKDRQVALEKKKQEKEYFARIMEENIKNKRKQRKKKEKEKLEDIAAQEAYARMLDQQEQDRKNELAAREKRA